MSTPTPQFENDPNAPQPQFETQPHFEQHAQPHGQAYSGEQAHSAGQTYASGAPYDQQGYGYQQSYADGYAGQQSYGYAGQQPYAAGAGAIPKSKIAAGLLGIFLGTFGVHNFYLGYITKAVVQLLLTVLSLGTLSWVSWIWGIIEGIFILTSQPGTQWHRDARGVELTD